MTDPLSLCASILAVVGAGLSLSKGLYNFAKRVKDADSSITDVARDVELTTSVLKALQSILQEEDQSKICSEDALKTAKKAIKDCRKVFVRMNDVLDLSETSLSKTAKVKWFFKEREMQYLSSNLDRLKSTLELLLGVLNLGLAVESKQARTAVEIQRQRAEVKALAIARAAQQMEFNRLRQEYGDVPDALIDALISCELAIWALRMEIDSVHSSAPATVKSAKLYEKCLDLSLLLPARPTTDENLGEKKPAQHPMRTQALQAEIDKTRLVLGHHIDKVAERGDRLDSLLDKTEPLSSTSQQYYYKARKTQKSSSWTIQLPTYETTIKPAWEYVRRGFLYEEPAATPPAPSSGAHDTSRRQEADEVTDEPVEAQPEPSVDVGLLPRQDSFSGANEVSGLTMAEDMDDLVVGNLLKEWTNVDCGP